MALDRYDLALDTERLDLRDYLAPGGPAEPVQFRSDRAAVARRWAALVQAVGPGTNLGPLHAAATAWQRWATGTVEAGPAMATAARMNDGTALFSRLQTRVTQLERSLDAAATDAMARAELAPERLAIVAPLLGFVLLGLLVLVGWLIFVSILNPVDQLATAAEAIADGRVTSLPDVGRGDELGELSRALAAWQEEEGARLRLAEAMAEEKAQQAHRLQALNRAAAELSGVLDPLALAATLVRRTEDLLGRARVAVAWHDDTTGELRTVAQSEGGELPRVPAVDEVLRDVVTAGRPRLARLPPCPGADAPPPVESLTAAPLLAGERRLGVLVAFAHDGTALDEADLQLLTLVAAQAAPTAEAARLHAELVGAHEKLIQANELLARQSRRKSEFLSAMSHDLRTPLNAILGFSELLLGHGSRAVDPSRLRTYAQHIHAGGQHLLGQVDQLLDMAKVEAGRMELRRTAVDVAAIIEDVRETVRPLAQKAGIELGGGAPTGLTVSADEEKLRRILLNLVSNAIKFTPSGGHVAVAASGDPDRVVFRVVDDGIGIPETEHERIFEEFRQLESGIPGRQAGTGLGLALVRELARLHGGRVWVKSEPGRGSTFFVELPAQADGAPAEGAAEGPLMLVIEDDSAAATLLEDTLELAGYRTEVLRDATAAVEEARRLRPFGIMLDLGVARRQGWNVLRELRSSDATKSIRIVAVQVVGERVRGVALGVAGLVFKPVDADRLREATAPVGLETGRTKLVLGIDDDPAALAQLEAALGPERTLHRASTGAGALSALRLRHGPLPDLIVLDILVDGGRGLQLMPEMQADERLAQIPVLLVVNPAMSDEDRALIRKTMEEISTTDEGDAELLRHLRRLREARTGSPLGGPATRRQTGPR